MTVAKLIENSGLSDSKLARAISASIPELKVATKSLATYIGKLRRGDRRWWQRSEAGICRVALADALGSHVDDLFPECLAGRIDPAFAVRGWQAYQPFDPSHEAMVDAGDIDAGRDYSGRPRTDHVGLLEFLDGLLRRKSPVLQWITVPPGGGKTFALACLKQDGVATASLSRLRDVREFIPDTTELLALCLDAPMEVEDQAWLERLQTRENVIVLASFPMRESDPHDEPRGDGPWNQVVWRPSAVRRRDLIAWASERGRGESMLTGDSERVAIWLDDVDPDCMSIGTPDAVLWVCARVHHVGLPTCKKLGIGGLIQPYFEAIADEVAKNQPDDAAWLRQHGRRAIRLMLRARATRLDLPGWHTAPESEWAALVATLNQPPLDIRARLQQLATTNNRPDRQAAADLLAAELSQSDGATVVSLFERVGLLAHQGRGLLAITATWLTSWEVTSYLSECVSSESLEWGRLGFDPARCDKIDEVLDATVIERKQLATLLSRMPERPSGAAEIGAVEATFAAVGRAFLEGRSVASEPGPLHHLCGAQLSCAIDRYANHLPLPMSRRDTRGTGQAFHEWMKHCWAWSLCLDAPKSPIPQALEWLFIGWSDPAPSTMPAEIREGWGADETGWVFDQLVGFWQRHPDEVPPPQASMAAQNAWAWTRICAGETPRHGDHKRIRWDWLIRLHGEPPPHPDMRWREQARLLVEAFIHDAEDHKVARALFRPDGLWRRLIASLVDGDLAIAIAEASQLEPHALLAGEDTVLRWLPHRVHVDLIRWALSKDPGFGSHSSSIDRGGRFFCDHAVAELAKHHADKHWLPVQTWTQRDPDAALAWLKETRWASPSSHAVYCGLPPHLEDDLLSWVEAQSGSGQPEKFRKWSIYMMPRRPEYAERWLALLRPNEPRQ